MLVVLLLGLVGYFAAAAFASAKSSLVSATLWALVIFMAGSSWSGGLEPVRRAGSREPVGASVAHEVGIVQFVVRRVTHAGDLAAVRGDQAPLELFPAREAVPLERVLELAAIA
jgi:hypothetical protein